MTEPKKLPPLAVWCGNREGATVEGQYPHLMTVDQAAEAIRRCEMHDRLLEAVFMVNDMLRHNHVDLAREKCRAILKENSHGA